jgi:hypothetical protein
MHGAYEYYRRDSFLRDFFFGSVPLILSNDHKN